MSKQHIVPRESGWAVIAENADKATALFDNKQEAIRRARILARNQDSYVVEHGLNGQIQSVVKPQPDDSWKDIKVRKTGLRPTQHVIPHTDGWAVKSEGKDKPAFVEESKYAAVAKAHKQAQDYGSTLIIHNEDGTFRQIDEAPHFPGPIMDAIKSM